MVTEKVKSRAWHCERGLSSATNSPASASTDIGDCTASASPSQNISQNGTLSPLYVHSLLYTLSKDMDPLSITVSVLSLVGRSITTIQTCQRYASKYQDAELSMSSLRTECSAINLALSQIQRLITRDQRRNLKDRFEDYVLVEYESVLTGYQLVFTTFNARASELGLDKDDNLKEATFWEKVKYVWNEPQMESLRGGISGQANAVGILLSVFQALVYFSITLSFLRKAELIDFQQRELR